MVKIPNVGEVAKAVGRSMNKATSEADRLMRLRESRRELFKRERQLTKRYQEIGERTFRAYLAEMTVPPEVVDLCQSASALRSEIREIEARMHRLQEANEELGPRVCTSCGATLETHFRYCSHCGQAIKV